ncbi:MAG: PaaI family thioesterase [Lachnospiraceae bacterium]|nr:PaaI family thioesterase [Lachnospiraceae bacterium]
MDYELLKKVRQEKNAFCQSIGIEILEIGPGTARTRLSLGAMHQNPIGSVHGGCIFTMADTTAGSAASSHGIQVTTLDSTIHFLRPGLNADCLYAEAREIKQGKRVSVYSVEVTDGEGLLLAHATFTYASLGKPIDLSLEP